VAARMLGGWDAVMLGSREAALGWKP